MSLINPGFAGEAIDWRSRLDRVVEAMRAVSSQTDPQAMVREYARRIETIMPSIDRMVAVSRRELSHPKYCITRSNLWKEEINPWKERDRLPTFDRGLLGDLIYADKPAIIDDLKIAHDDPGREYFAGQRSLLAAPLYDQGVAMNMVVIMRPEPAAFNREFFPDWVLMSNLFGRATHNLVLSDQLKAAYEIVDSELRAVEEMQRSLLPKQLPKIESLDLAAHDQTSARAGGDYYDFFPLPDGSYGILIADVSGHGTPAAVMMAITHSIAHQFPGPPQPPGRVLEFVNRKLVELYTGDNPTFVTAFYGIYNPQRRTLWYASAGHNPPRVKRCSDGSTFGLDGTAGLPMGIEAGERYEEARVELVAGDQIIFYTDGITEAMNLQGEQYGSERLDEAICGCMVGADALIRAILADIDRFTAGAPATDDRTLLVAKAR